MATNVKDFSKKTYVWLKVDANVTDIDHSDTRSKVYVKVTMGTNENTYKLDGSSYYVKVDGSTIKSGITTYDFRGSKPPKVIFSGYHWVNHSTDGTHTINITARLSDSHVGTATPSVNIAVKYEGGKVYVGTKNGVKRGQVYVGTKIGVKKGKEAWVGASNGKKKAK